VSSERPPAPEEQERDGEREHERRRLERILPELIKRALETGFEKLSDGYERIAESPDNVRGFVRELKLPKEVLHVLLGQVDETKNGLYRVVAKEIRDFLEHTNVAEELSKALTTLSFEIKTEVRFVPNDSRVGSKPDVKSKVRIKRERSASMPPEPEPEETEEP
jgi:hypothetical protein